MSIRRWHWGKVVILWSWGGIVVALLLTNFLTTPVGDAPLVALTNAVLSLVVLIVLTVITWVWLDGQEAK